MKVWRRRACTLLAGVLVLLCLTPVVAFAANPAYVRFIAVGKGDATLIETPEGRTILVDAGAPEAGPAVVAALRSAGVERVDLLIATHAHGDHVGGMGAVLEAFPVGALYAPRYIAEAAPSWYDTVRIASEQGVPVVRTPPPGSSLPLGSSAVGVRVLGPLRRDLVEGNNNCTVLRVVHGRYSFLLAADAQAGEEAALLARHLVPRSTALKIAHHGRSDASTRPWISAISPQRGVISNATGAGYPTAGFLAQLRSMIPTVYRTGEDGTVKVRSTGTALTWSTLPAPVP